MNVYCSFLCCGPKLIVADRWRQGGVSGCFVYSLDWCDDYIFGVPNDIISLYLISLFLQPFTVNTVDGQALYGPGYKSLHYFAAIHNDAGIVVLTLVWWINIMSAKPSLYSLLCYFVSKLGTRSALKFNFQFWNFNFRASIFTQAATACVTSSTLTAASWIITFS